MARSTAHKRAAHLLDRARAAPPRAGTVRLLGIDGFSGAGKTTLAVELRRADPTVTVLSLETFYLGWDGLAAGPRRAHEQLVGPLTRGEVPVVEPWDWRHDRVAPRRRRPVGPLVVLEGCGAGAQPLRAALSLLVWVDADPRRAGAPAARPGRLGGLRPAPGGLRAPGAGPRRGPRHAGAARTSSSPGPRTDASTRAAADGDEWVRSGRDGDEGPA